MEIKKNPEVDLRTYRTIFSLLGLSVSLGLILGLFYYKKYEKQKEASLSMEYFEEEIDVDQTFKEKPKPKPKTQPPKLEIAEADEIPPEQPKMQSSEDQGKPAPPPPPPPSSEPEGTDEPMEWYDVSEKAEFKGNLDQFINDNLVYPVMAVEEGIEGRVMVQFVVEKDGSINCNSIAILSRPFGFQLEEEAKKVMCKTSGMWVPAKQRDKAVRMTLRIPIRFQLGS